MKVLLWCWLCVHLVTGVWPAHSNKQIIFRRDVTNDVALALATVLPTYQYIDESFI